jgi:hypothetical protein
MPRPSQLSQRKPYRYVIAGLALVGAGTIAVIHGAAQSPKVVHLPEIQLTSGDADIIIDFVRHADTNPPDATDFVANNGLPGAPVSGLPGVPPVGDNGLEQATDTATLLHNELGNGIAGIFGGYEQRMIETAIPMLQDLGLPVTALDPTDYFDPDYYSPDFQTLNGLDEIAGGIYADSAPGTPGALASELTSVLWLLGAEFVPILGSNDWNGIQFDENFSGAVSTIYTDTVGDAANPATGLVTDLAYSGEGAILGWTILNVNNPDLAILIPAGLNAFASGELLPPAGVVEVEGNPTDGWTLESFAGQAYPENPGLLTELFVDGRDAILAPQTAAWNIFESIFTGPGAPTITSVGDALLTNSENVGETLLNLPGSIITDIDTEVQTLVTDVAGGESFNTAFDATILGLVS